MILVAFRSRLRSELIEEVIAMDAEMAALVQSIPGFIEYKEFAAEDGEVLNIALFTDTEALRIWREHPRHREAMRLGYDRWMLSYDIRVCEVLRSYTRLEREQAVAQGAPAPGTGPIPLVSNNP